MLVSSSTGGLAKVVGSLVGGAGSVGDVGRWENRFSCFFFISKRRFLPPKAPSPPIFGIPAGSLGFVGSGASGSSCFSEESSIFSGSCLSSDSFSFSGTSSISSGVFALLD